MAVCIVDQVIGEQNAFVATEDVVRRWNEREMPPEPSIFGTERVRKFHSRGGDKDLVVFRELGQHLLAVLNHREIFKKVFATEVGFQALVMVGGDDVP